MTRRETVYVMGLGYIGSPIMAKEYNIESHDEFEIVPDNKAIERVDIIVFLVAQVQGKEVLDFCGVMNR